MGRTVIVRPFLFLHVTLFRFITVVRQHISKQVIHNKDNKAGSPSPHIAMHTDRFSEHDIDTVERALETFSDPQD